MWISTPLYINQIAPTSATLAFVESSAATHSPAWSVAGYSVFHGSPTSVRSDNDNLISVERFGAAAGPKTQIPPCRAFPNYCPNCPDHFNASSNLSRRTNCGSAILSRRSRRDHTATFAGLSAVPQLLANHIFLLGICLRRSAEEFHQSLAGCSPGPFLEELSRGFHNSDFLRNCRRDPLVQGHTVFLGQALRGLLNRKRKFQRKCCFAHDFTFLRSSGGLNTRIPKRSHATAKSATLWVQSP
jgi:hypothetical protein